MPLRELDLRLASPSRSTRCSGCGSSPAAGTLGNCAAKSASWLAKMLSSDAGVQSRAARVDVQRRSRSPALSKAAASASVMRRARIDVGRAADALPVVDRAAGRARGGDTSSKRVARAVAAAVLVAGHHDDGLLAAREVPEARHRLALAVHLHGSGWRAAAAARRPAGSRPCARSTQSGCGSPAAAPKNRSSERIGADAVALRARPGGVALAGQHDRARQVEGERAAWPPLDPTRVRVSRRGWAAAARASVASVASRRGAARGVLVGRPVELHRRRRCRRPEPLGRSTGRRSASVPGSAASGRAAARAAGRAASRCSFPPRVRPSRTAASPAPA